MAPRKSTKGGSGDKQHCTGLKRNLAAATRHTNAILDTHGLSPDVKTEMTEVLALVTEVRKYMEDKRTYSKGCGSDEAKATATKKAKPKAKKK